MDMLTPDSQTTAATRRRRGALRDRRQKVARIMSTSWVAGIKERIRNDSVARQRGARRRPRSEPEGLRAAAGMHVLAHYAVGRGARATQLLESRRK